MLTAKEAIQKLKSGNEKYLIQSTGSGDVSPAVRLRTSVQGQQPYAIIITCSDSRVIPESIFSAGIGESCITFLLQNSSREKMRCSLFIYFLIFTSFINSAICSRLIGLYSLASTPTSYILNPSSGSLAVCPSGKRSAYFFIKFDAL